MAKRLLASPLGYLSFSFDGCTPEVYERLRPPAKFDRVRANIRRYLQIKENDSGRGPYTTVEIIRMRETESYIDSFLAEWTDSGADDVHVTECMMWHDSVPDHRPEETRLGSAYNPCAAPFRHGCVLADGTAVPCCTDVNGQLPLGNVTERPFSELWTGNSYRQLRLSMLTGTLPEDSICSGCCNLTRQSASAMPASSVAPPLPGRRPTPATGDTAP
jgi:MoaA/NifB/PqqE/SkfB family radical SAM enzyme